jgi:hypothetical protein
MPIVFIHGVNVRAESKSFEREKARRQKLMRDVVLVPLRERGGRFAGMEMHDIYWGDLGVTFSWNLTSMPKAKFLDSFGPDEDASVDILLEQGIESVARENAGKSDHDHSSDSSLKLAAKRDAIGFAETLLLPILLSDFLLSDENSNVEGELQALLAEAANQAASDAAVQQDLAAANSDSELINVFRIAVERRLRILLQASATDSSAIESYGGSSDHVRLKIRELFERALNLPSRILSAPTMRVVRPGFNRTVSRFFGDVFVYLQHRGTRENPGPIVERVISGLKNIPRAHADEPLIVVTHSMGGNILYDVFTSFSPDLHADVWISVGGQVAQFEEMKLFMVSDPAVKTPSKVAQIKDRVGYWLNVYDPLDPFSYMASPVFADVDDDLPFSTGGNLLKSHGEYFGRASFHELLKKHIEKGLGLQ